jgi:hypothetical protein
VFYGHDDAELERATSPASPAASCSAPPAWTAKLQGALDAAGPRADPPPSTIARCPFAVGSLAWSRTVTGVVRVWCDAWRRGGGDLARTPYLPTEERRRREQDR